MNYAADAMGPPYGSVLGQLIWNAANGTLSFNSTGGAANGPCLQFSYSDRIARYIFGTTVSPNIYFGAHFQLSELPASGAFNEIFSTGDNSGDFLNVSVDSVGALNVFNGYGALLYKTPAGVIQVGLTNKVEVGSLLNFTTGTVEVHINEQVIGSASGVSTAPSTTRLYTSYISLYGPLDAGHTFSNVYYNDGSGEYNNSYEGSCFVINVYPVEDGSTVEFTPSSGDSHYDLVNSVPPNIAAYNSTSTLNQIETYGFGALPEGIETISLGRLLVYLLKTGAGGRALTGWVINGGSSEPLSQTYLADGYQYIRSSFNTDPITGDPLTPTGIVDNFYGVKVTV